MSKELKLTTNGIPPSVNGYLGHRAVRQGAGCMVMLYTKPEAKKFQKDFAAYTKEQVKLQGWDIEQTRNIHHYMDCVFYFDKKGRDEQNYMKVTTDVLNGIVFIDDKNVLTRTHAVYYSKEEPRIEITIYPVEYRGIFRSESHLNQFENTYCSNCKRNDKKNCSILKGAKEGRVQENISFENDTYICSKFNQKPIK